MHSSSTPLTKRLSLQDLEKDENAQAKNDFLKAWQLIKQKSDDNPDDPESYYQLGTYHGMPFNKADTPEGDLVWGGWCQHANVLFPTWHRYYCLAVEKALQKVVPGTALHYWDQTVDNQALPKILTDEKVQIDGTCVENPLLSSTLPVALKNTSDENSIYVKPVGYTTVRFPYSGIQNPENQAQVATDHNNKINAQVESGDLDVTAVFESNISNYLLQGRNKYDDETGTQTQSVGVKQMYIDCLDTLTYNEFSNTSTAGDNKTASLEQPHNDMHVAVGGFTQYRPNPETGEIEPVMHFGFIRGANGDMGANEVASFDPIFFLHHANIDRMFWVWQKKQGKTDYFTIDTSNPNDPGITPKDGQGPTPGQTKDKILTMDTPLRPYSNDGGATYLTSKGCINIEEQLGYTYSIGSLDQESWPTPTVTEYDKIKMTVNNQNDLDTITRKMATHRMGGKPIEVLADITSLFGNKAIQWKDRLKSRLNLSGDRFSQKFILSVEKIKKDDFMGSFAVHVSARKKPENGGKWFHVGQKSVLSRIDRSNCKNCQQRPFADLGFQIPFRQRMTRSDIKIHFIYKNPETGLTDTREMIMKDGGSTPVVKCYFIAIEQR